jgi:glycyl-tRNA synthetase beta chain
MEQKGEILNKSRFIIELGCEELPEKQLEIAISSVQGQFAEFLAGTKLDCSSFAVSGTPRRIYLDARGLDCRQIDEEIVRTGPAISIAYTVDGNLSPAGLGFLKKSGASSENVFTQQTEKGSFVAVRFTKQGRETSELLKDWIPNMILQIPFGKKMIWCNKELSFSRPLRWILCLWQERVLNLDFFGIKSGARTFGNRYLGLDRSAIISSAEEYLSALQELKVIASSDDRKDIIIKQLHSILAGTGYSVIEDLRLVDTVSSLVEFPTAVVAEFGARFLSLPEKIIISTISQNQKYFSVKDATGKLTNKFVFIANADPAWAELIRKGNEKVVNARLADALWYFEEDTKHPFEEWVKRLSEVVFQARLGTMADKTERIIKLTELIADELKLSDEEKSKAKRCAQLCKADLVTNMLGEKEFTKLQGYIGMQYATVSGEDPEVARGIYEHYMPRGSADSLPSSKSGSIVAIADKLDTVTGIIGIGLLPTGSGDPFALRRAANGIVQIISVWGWDIDLFALADKALELITLSSNVEPNTKQNIHDFLDQRIVGLLKSNDIDYDVIESVMHINKSYIHDLEHRARALNMYKGSPDFIKLVIGFKRVSNIIAETNEFIEFDHNLLVEPAEKALFMELQELHKKNELPLKNKNYGLALINLMYYGRTINAFFDSVLVNCDDTAIRNNRHALLLLIKQEFLRVADLSLIVLESEQ